MAAILRLAVHHSTMDTEYGYGTEVFNTTTPRLVSVIATNKGEAAAQVSIYTVPAGSESTPNEWGVMAHQLPLSVGNSYETFRFGLNPNDSIYVAGSADVAYFVQGITQ